ncbi:MULTISPECIES: hypothetical protein [Acinetobacter]|uniref:hypothetical protein n=1 Tax=Acinetobacter TaxID=469 RepID=UPI00141B5578|nr:MULTISPECIES: hypothetical protein [Acinetobacter]MCS4298915.1 hypothetical protein [Acinetobacter guillouiae]MCW2252347.1 hypothetical protein [Acinetobacter sp. BIGb0204]NII38066.1 hypothetical protein [Acinetobacter sp. BIGb0196]
MNKELQSFSRNITSQLLIGGIALLTLYRADTKPDLAWFKFTSLYVVGLLLLLWSIYSALSNACILYNDYRDYLWRQGEKFDLIRLMKHPKKEDNYLVDISKAFKGLKNVDLIKIRLEGACILLIWFLFAFVYILGIIIIFLQQAKVFNF